MQAPAWKQYAFLRTDLAIFRLPDVPAICIASADNAKTTERFNERRSGSGHGSHIRPLAEPDSLCRYGAGHFRSPRQAKGEIGGDAGQRVARRSDAALSPAQGAGGHRPA